jgi:hypothetical protein
MSHHPTSWRSISKLSSHQSGLPSVLFPSRVPTKILYTLLPFTMCASCPTHLILLHLITWTILGEKCRSLHSLFSSYLHSPLTSSLLCRNILFSTVFSNILSLRSSLIGSDHVSHQYKTTANHTWVHLNLYIISQQTGGQTFCTDW